MPFFIFWGGGGSKDDAVFISESSAPMSSLHVIHKGTLSLSCASAPGLSDTFFHARDSVMINSLHLKLSQDTMCSLSFYLDKKFPNFETEVTRYISSSPRRGSDSVVLWSGPGGL